MKHSCVAHRRQGRRVSGHIGQSVVLCTGLIVGAHAAAAEFVSISVPPQASANAAVQWSASDYSAARTVMPKVNFLPAQAFDYNAAAASTSPAVYSSPGGPGNTGAQGLVRMLPLTAGSSATPNLDIAPQAIGTNAGSIQFTSSRVAATSTEEAQWPRSAVGKVFFKIGTASYMCSGSLIKPGILLTAGHCTHSGNNAASGWYNSWQYLPAYRSGAAPYGVWSSYATVYTTSNWYSGGGAVPNLRDWALIVLNRNASGKRVGDYTGTLGVQYPSLIGKQVTAIGYPGNLDAGAIQHSTNSMSNNLGAVSNGIWGSDMEGGSSGGPVVLNYGLTYTNSSTQPSDNLRNMAVSVVSWGYTNTAVKVQGGSQFDSVLGTMLTTACKAYPWAC